MQQRSLVNDRETERTRVSLPAPRLSFVPDENRNSVMNETSYIFPELQSGHFLREQFGSGLQDKSNLL